MSERKFIQKVWMQCENKEQQSLLIDKLQELGYDHNPTSFGFDHNPLICTCINGKHNLCGSSTHDNEDPDMGWPEGFLGIKTPNPELFLALAACSATNEFFPGEWVKCIHKQKSGRITMDGLYQVVSHVSGVVKLAEPFDDSFSYSDAFFRKASAAEIVAHFEKKEERVEVDSKIGKYPSIAPHSTDRNRALVILPENWVVYEIDATGHVIFLQTTDAEPLQEGKHDFISTGKPIGSK